MAYQFVNRSSGKTQITDETNAVFTLNGINTKTDDADMIMDGLETLLDIVGWTIADVNRVVTQDIEEGE